MAEAVSSPKTEMMHSFAMGILQDPIVVVSLIRTLTDSFGSASDLYRKLKRSSGSKSSDDEDDEPKSRRRRPHRRRDSSSSDQERLSLGRRVLGNRNKEKESYSDSDEELICEASPQIQAEYDRGYRKIGEPYARGDSIAKIHIQSQIIALQGTLLDIHQDIALSTYNAPSSYHSHLIRLVQTSRSARAATIQALRMLHDRMLESPPPEELEPHRPEREPRRPGREPHRPERRESHRPELIEPHHPDRIEPHRPGRRSPYEPERPGPHHSIPGAFPPPPGAPREDYDSDGPPPRRKSRHRSHSRGRSRSRSHSPDPLKHPHPHPPVPAPAPPSNKLFCVYARDLQFDPDRPLSASYQPGGSNTCPYCRAHVAIRPGKAWEVLAESSRGHGRYRRFLVRNRFVVKCHREHGGFACVLCARHRDSDTVCREIGALMEHLWKEHSSEELEGDEDVEEC